MNELADNPAITATLVGLVLTNLAGFAVWFFKRLVHRVEKLEEAVPHKADTAVLNETVASFRRRSDENADRLAAQMIELERVMAARQQELLLSLTKNIQDAIKMGQRG